MRYFGFKKRSFGLKTIGWAGSTASALADLFKNGEQGVWLDPSDLSTMFQDVNGTVPVTKDGEPVALIKDKSGNGNHATQPTASARPIYRTDGNLHWLEFDGVDDHLLFNKNTFLVDRSLAITTGYNLLKEGIYPSIITGLSTDAGLEQYHLSSTVKRRVTVVTTTGIGNGDSAKPLPLNKTIIRTTKWSRSIGVVSDILNRNDTFISYPALPNALLVPPGDYYSIGRISDFYTCMNFYGVVAVNIDLSPNEIEGVERFMANKSGVTL